MQGIQPDKMLNYLKETIVSARCVCELQLDAQLRRGPEAVRVLHLDGDAVSSFKKFTAHVMHGIAFAARLLVFATHLTKHSAEHD